MFGQYILDKNKNPVEATVEEYFEWTKSPDFIKKIANSKNESVWVSTVFLGLDHSYHYDTSPVLFETMVFFEDERDEICERYHTYAEAVEGHERICVQYGLGYSDAVVRWLNEP